MQRKSRRLGHKQHSFQVETANPMENLANLVDIMLVFACALMIAIITHWNVDLTQQMISEEDLELVEDPQMAIQNNIESSNFESKGIVYEDPETGDLYIITNN